MVKPFTLSSVFSSTCVTEKQHTSRCQSKMVCATYVYVTCAALHAAISSQIKQHHLKTRSPRKKDKKIFPSAAAGLDSKSTSERFITYGKLFREHIQDYAQSTYRWLSDDYHSFLDSFKSSAQVETTAFKVGMALITLRDMDFNSCIQ